MTKDEMIEEMAKVLCDKDKRCEECISRLLLPCGYKSYCTKLYNAGYRKVADDEIVVKKIKEPFVFYDNREEIEKRMQEYEEEIAQAKQEEVREILTTIYNNLKYATVKQTGTLISIKTLATELGIELE